MAERTRKMKKVRATRQNGRKGKEGVFKAGHNDRSFDPKKTDHINPDKSVCNVYWDFIQGLNIADENGIRPERKYNFDEIELAYYISQFGEAIEAQNERHLKARHPNRVRSVKDVLKNAKTCPEESVYQLGTKDGYADPVLFAQVVVELITEVEKRYGTNYKVLDWALHMDEATPHIHERHVFFAPDDYGLIAPQQDRACEELGFEKPDPEKDSTINNFRKMSFDAEIRRLYIEIAEKYGITIEKVPLKGKKHLEKNDFILAKQNEEKAANEAYLAEQRLKISDIDAFAEEVAGIAYEKACEVVIDKVVEETAREHFSQLDKIGNWIMSDRCKASASTKQFGVNVLQSIRDKLEKTREAIISSVRKTMKLPEIKTVYKHELTKKVKPSIHDLLSKAKDRVAKNEHARTTDKNISERKGKTNER